MAATQTQFEQIKTFIFDIDGVLTDGGVHLLASGERFRTIFIRDMYALEQALKTGFRVAIISAANADGLRRWLESLNVKDVFMGGPSDQKLNAYLGYLTRDGLNESEVLYMGDDLPDLPILSRPAVLGVCPADAVADVRAASQYVSSESGGRGAVRDVIEQVMRAQGKWPV